MAHNSREGKLPALLGLDYDAEETFHNYVIENSHIKKEQIWNLEKDIFYLFFPYKQGISRALFETHRTGASSEENLELLKYAINGVYNSILSANFDAEINKVVAFLG